MKKLNRTIIKNVLICLGISALLIGLDQLTKYLAVKNLELYDEIPFIKGFINFKLVYNTGFAFGLGDGFQWIWSIVSLIGCFVIGYFMIKADFKHNLVFTICIILLFSGTFGNMIDRIFNKDGVIDFINPAFVDFAVFNFADSYITIGGILLGIYVIFIYKDDKKIDNSNTTFEENENTKYVEIKAEENTSKNDEVEEKSGD